MGRREQNGLAKVCASRQFTRQLTLARPVPKSLHRRRQEVQILVHVCVCWGNNQNRLERRVIAGNKGMPISSGKLPFGEGTGEP